MSKAIMAGAALLCVVFGEGSAHAQTVEDVQFAPGDYGGMLEGSVTGQAYVDHRLGATAGQDLFAALTVAETDGNGIAFFNVLPPGSDGVAIYNSSVEGNSTVVPLPEDGTYTIRVYLMGNDRDTDKRVDYLLDVSIQ